jgi:Mn-dependent DtxR family transcriptional regulator
MKIHASGEDYLEAVLILQKKQGMVRFVDVARYVEVSKPSVCHAVATLRDGGFLTMDSDYFLHLTDVGREVAEQIYEKHRRIAESGTHKKFLAKGGKYAAMWNTEQKISA